MTVPTATAAVEDYLDGVRLALADLPEDDRQDLLEDLRGHLLELTAEEPEVDLTARLGRTDTYADELRQSAGLPPRSGRRRPPFRRAALVEAVRALPGGTALIAFLPQLRPTWWVARAWGVLDLVDWTVHDAGGYRWGSGVIPEVHGSKGMGTLVLAALIVVSIRIGIGAIGAQGWQRKALVIANLALIVLTPLYFARTSTATQDPFISHFSCCGTLEGENGQVVSNIYAYDENGQRIGRVQLFDQDGQPINLSNNSANSPLHNVFPQQDPAFVITNADGSVAEVGVAPTPSPEVPRLAPTIPPAVPSPSP